MNENKVKYKSVKVYGEHIVNFTLVTLKHVYTKNCYFNGGLDCLAMRGEL